MTIVNRRNAVVGYLAIKTGKIVARRKAKQVGGKLTPPWGNSNNKSDKKGDKQSKKS
ncbi:MAG TPA: hypothetical protein VHQ99_06045 [Gaiellaceae bacterium]|jgi:hypothetical protein|nr:hypothetical protein [Gaiellaceae bacterium]